MRRLPMELIIALQETLWEACRHRECPAEAFDTAFQIQVIIYEGYLKKEKRQEAECVQLFKRGSSSCYQQFLGEYLGQSK